MVFVSFEMPIIQSTGLVKTLNFLVIYRYVYEIILVVLFLTIRREIRKRKVAYGPVLMANCSF